MVNNISKRADFLGYFFFIAFLALGVFAFARFGVPVILDKLEVQRAAEKNYNCAHYGAAMNRFYGRDVCEDEALHKAILKTETQGRK